MEFDFKKLGKLLPAYPKTPHLSYRPNMAPGDTMMTADEDTHFLFQSESLIIEEKIDGANCAMMWDGENVILRNRDHILQKGYLKDTPAKIQFRPLWGWFYAHQEAFEYVNKVCGHPVGVAGEWCLALHGIVYDKLPSFFIAFDIYDPEKNGFLTASRKILTDAGFTCPPLIHKGPIRDFEQLDEFCNAPSAWGPDGREGIYIKDFDGQTVSRRCKMIRSGYVQGCKWSTEVLTKQKLAKKVIQNKEICDVC